MMISLLFKYHILAYLQNERDQLHHCERHYLILVFEEIVVLVNKTFAKWVIIKLLIVGTQLFLKIKEYPALQDVNRNAKYLGVEDPDFQHTE